MLTKQMLVYVKKHNINTKKREKGFVEGVKVKPEQSNL